jgi:lambda repressor-like predicted transcriptional regulator
MCFRRSTPLRACPKDLRKRSFLTVLLKCRCIATVPDMKANTLVTEVSMSARISLRTSQYRKVMASKGWGTLEAQSSRIGVDPATISRVLKGRTAPGERFIAGLLLALPEWEFADLFEVTVDGDDTDEVA